LLKLREMSSRAREAEVKVVDCWLFLPVGSQIAEFERHGMDRGERFESVSPVRFCFSSFTRECALSQMIKVKPTSSSSSSSFSSSSFSSFVVVEPFVAGLGDRPLQKQKGAARYAYFTIPPRVAGPTRPSRFL
jgi:hypothetical protein